jgi:hypothetical protein
MHAADIKTQGTCLSRFHKTSCLPVVLTLRSGSIIPDGAPIENENQYVGTQQGVSHEDPQSQRHALRPL